MDAWQPVMMRRPFSCTVSDDGQMVGWGGDAEVSMGQFRSLTAYLIKEANRLCNDLMFGLEPDIDLLKIKDNMAHCDKEYYFVTDPRNELTSAYLDLFKRACTARSGCLERKFLELVRGQPILEKGGEFSGALRNRDVLDWRSAATMAGAF
jgi:hypothetical protein